MSMRDLEQKDKHGCIRGKQRWNGTKCVAVDPQKVSEQATTNEESTQQVQGTPQSVNVGEGPKGIDWHKRRTAQRAKMASLAKQHKKVGPPQTKPQQTERRKSLIDHIKSKRKVLTK